MKFIWLKDPKLQTLIWNLIDCATFANQSTMNFKLLLEQLDALGSVSSGDSFERGSLESGVEGLSIFRGHSQFLRLKIHTGTSTSEAIANFKGIPPLSKCSGIKSGCRIVL